MEKEIRVLNPRRELMSREDLEALQNKKLKRQIKYVYENSSFFHKRLDEGKIKPEDVKNVEDLSKIPMVTREELQREVQRSSDFYGGRLCVDEEEILMSFSPPDWPFMPLEEVPFITAITISDQKEVVELLSRIWIMEGINPGDLVQLQCWAWEPLGFAFCLPSHTPGLPSVGQMLGCRVIPHELFVPDVPRTIHTGRFFHPAALFTTDTAIATLESYLTPLEERENITVEVPVSESTSFEVVSEEKFYPRDIGYRTIILRSPFYELSYATEERRREIREAWGVKDVYTLLDVQDNFLYASDCSIHEGLHIWEDAFVVEVIDEEGNPVGAGEKGNMVITNLFAKATPIIRYKTDIIVSMEEEKCNCGRSHRRVIMEV